MLNRQEIHEERLRKNMRYRRRCEGYSRGQRRCHCCGVQMNWSVDSDRSASVEHMVPKTHGGTLAYANCLIICRKCNNGRNSQDWIEFVVENQFPKKEWLIAKYIEAVEYYYKAGRKLNKGLKRNYEKHMA